MGKIVHFVIGTSIQAGPLQAVFDHLTKGRGGFRRFDEWLAGDLIWPTGNGWWLIVAIALLPSLLSQLLFMRGVELIGPGRAGLFVNLTPVLASALAVLLLGEQFHWYHAAALCLAFGGIWLSERGSRA